MAETADLVPAADFGTGIDILTGKALGVAIDFDAAQPIGGLQGQQVATSLEVITNEEDYESAFSTSGSLSASAPLFGGGAKAQFIRNSKMQQYSVFLAAHVTVVNTATIIKNPRFRPSANDLLAKGNEARFREQFGDTFVSGLLTGGEYCAVLQIDSAGSDEQSSITAAINAHGGIFGFGASAGADLAKAVHDVSKDSKISATFCVTGGSSQTIDASIDAILAAASTFPAQCVGQQAFPFQMQTQDYKILDLPTAPNWVDVQVAQDVLSQLTKQRATLITASNSVRYVLQNASQFDHPENYNLEALDKQITESLNAVYDAASRCADNPVGCRLPDISMPLLRLPPRKPPANPITLPKIRFDPSLLQKLAQMRTLAPQTTGTIAKPRDVHAILIRSAFQGLGAPN